MGKSANTFTGEGFDFFGFLENGLFGDKISALFDADSNMGRIITMIAAFIIAAAVLMIAAENLRAAVSGEQPKLETNSFSSVLSGFVI